MTAASDEPTAVEGDGDRAGEAPRGTALVVVRNPCTHDSRILREAHTLRDLGYRPLVLAVTSDDERRSRSSEEGIPILRISPTSPLAWLRARLRRDSGRDRARPGSPLDDVLPAPLSGGRGGPLRSLLLRAHRWARTIDYYRRGVGVLRATRPALVHCNDYNTMWVGLAARAFGRSAVIYDAHELWPDRNLRPEPRWWLLFSESLFVRLADRTITASPGYARVMARRYRVAPPLLVRNIPGRTGPSGAELERAEPDQRSAAYVGALTRNRGLEVAIEAIARTPDVRLRLIGPARPPYRAELSELARGRGVAGRVEFVPPVPPGQVVPAVAQADVGLALIQPACLSYEMSLPNKLFEYVLAGLPVLASDLPVIGAFVREHDVGLVARPGDPEDVAAKLQELLRPDRNQAFREAARRAAGELRWESESVLLRRAYEEAALAAGSRA